MFGNSKNLDGITWKNYNKQVRRTIKLPIKKGFDRSHKLSVKVAFLLSIPIEFVNHPNNIFYENVKDNRSRGDVSLISYEEFSNITNYSNTKKTIRKSFQNHLIHLQNG